jgi:magnesium chelatase family protein
MALLAAKLGLKTAILPHQNAKEASVVTEIEIRPAVHLRQVCEELMGQRPVSIQVADSLLLDSGPGFGPNFSEVKGQQGVKRAIEVAAAGGHNMLMIGPPGSGKTMLAKRLPGILPPMTREEALEVSRIHSVAVGKGQSGLLTSRPFRSPHHTISEVALTGGGSQPKPGEISLAHHGVLFLDELPEFKRTVLEVMRQPLEERRVTISRAKFSIEYPASFMLVASMNPCPCGYFNHPEKECVCGLPQVQRYLSKISGPLLDRIDIHIEVTPVNFDQLTDTRKAEPSINIRERVIKAREIQGARYAAIDGIYCNAQMSSTMAREFCMLTHVGQNLLKNAMNKLQLSARAYDRILKVARTISDLAGSEEIKIEHLAEAIQYRSLERELGRGLIV